MLLAPTLESIVVRRPRPTRRRPQGLCLDKAYDITWVYRLLTEAGFTPHVRGRREEIVQRTQGYRARRWVVERTHSRMNHFRGLLVRREKRTVNHVGALHLACAYIAFARAGRLG